jgi:predicted aspartyl protease
MLALTWPGRSRSFQTDRWEPFLPKYLVSAPHTPERREPVKLLVDTGSTYTWVSAVLLRRLGIDTTERRRIVTIEGVASERDLAEILVTLDDRTLHTVCLLGRARDLDVLGAYTLEGFGLAADPVQRRLVPAIVYGAASGVTVRIGSSSAPASPASSTHWSTYSSSNTGSPR